MADKILYIKVSKIDGNGVDQTFTLQTLQQITIPWGAGNSTETFEIFSITEFQDHFLYGVNPNNVLDPVTVTNSRAKIEYDFSSSILTTSPTFNSTSDYDDIGADIIKIPLINPTIDNLNFYNSNNQSYVFNTYPQKLITIYASGSVFFEPAGTNNPSNKFANVDIVLKRGGIEFPLGQVTTPFQIPSAKEAFTLNNTLPVTGSFEISASIDPTTTTPTSILPGDEFYLSVVPFAGGDVVSASFSPDTFFSISSSIASGPLIGTVPEPFQSENFSNAFDCQPLYGNANENQTSYKWMQVDHTNGIMIPINFDLIINGNALKAQVQDSNYTSLAHTTSRYLGSKNQSPQINKWINSELNIGNFGKTTSVELDKTSIAYSQFVGGWPPEKSNASTVKVLHTIDEDGNLFTPGASKNFLSNLQGNFESGDNVIITPLNVGGNAEAFTRKVLRSGQTIKPYFHNQIKFAERDVFAEFTSSLEFEEINPAGTAITENYSVGLNIDGAILSTGVSTGVNTWADLPRLSVFSIGSNVDPSQISNNLISYTINSGLMSTNIQSLTFDLNLNLESYNPTDGTFYTKLIRIRGGNETELILTPAGSTYNSYGSGVVPQFSGGSDDFNDSIFPLIPLQFRHTVPKTEIEDGDIFKVQFIRGQIGIYPINGVSFYSNITHLPFRVSQTPSPTPDFILSGPGVNLFNTFEGIGILDVLYPNNIYVGDIKYEQLPSSPISIISNPTGSAFLSTYYDNENVKQTNIPNSGYNNISLPIKFEVGDEVRFEGDKVFMIQNVENIDGIVGGISSSVLLITLDSQIINTGIDINKFSFTRYIDDPTTIIIEGFKPQLSDGPYLVRPEFITNKLDDNINSYINDFTDKGLL